MPFNKTNLSRILLIGLRKIAGISLIIIITVLLTEAALWLFAPIKFHEWMIWVPDGHIISRPAPNQVIHNAEGYEVRINRFGFRGPDYTWKPQAKTLRIGVFGGSSSFCFNSKGEENTWPGRLQKYLTETLQVPVEVVNLGAPGYACDNSKINYLFLGRALQIHVALVYHTWNDMRYFRQLANGPGPVFIFGYERKPFWEKLARMTQVGRYGRNFWWSLTKRKLEGVYKTTEKTDTTTNQPVSSKAFAWERKNFQDFVSFTKSDGVLPVLISQATICVTENLDKEEYRLLMMPDYVRMSLPILCQTWIEVNNIIQDIAQEQGAIFVDGYNTVPHDIEHLEDHVHLTDKGNDVLAKKITQTLINNQHFMQVVQRVCGRSNLD